MVPVASPSTRQPLPYVLGNGCPLGGLYGEVTGPRHEACIFCFDSREFPTKRAGRAGLGSLAAGYEDVVEIFLLSTRLFHLIRVPLLIEKIDDGLVLAMGRQITPSSASSAVLQALGG